jgi:hypothetical protein
MARHKTIINGLEPYAFGPKLSAFRLRKSHWCSSASTQGCPRQMLSKIENGKLFLWLKALELVCRLLQVAIGAKEGKPAGR